MSKKRKGNRQVARQPAPTPNRQYQVVEATSYSGPLPDPRTLERFDEVVPGSAARIIDAFEEESRHRRSQEVKMLGAQIADASADRQEAKRGQVFGLIIGLAAIASGAGVALAGAEIAGGFIGAGGVAGLVAVFVKGRWGQSGKRDEGGVAEESPTV